MIKLFRRIRQNLLSQGKTGKYFKYAIGEILLVVIGILIALQINNWNEQNKNNQIEETYLIRLNQDLDGDIMSWGKLIEDEEKRFKGIKEFIKFGLNKNIDSVLNVFPHFNIIVRWDDLTINQVTFDEMKNSGKLDIISNDSIKISLLELDQLYQKIIERNATRKLSHDKHISDPIFDILNTLNFIVLDNKLSELHPKTYTREELESHLELIRNDLFNLFHNQEFMNSLVTSIYNYELVSGELQEAHSKAKKLKVLIEDELDEK